MDSLERELLDAAIDARRRAHAPKSKNYVGAALRERTRGIITGANVESASGAASMCAERIAIANAILGGAEELLAIALVAEPEARIYPCGLCRQLISEFFAPEAKLICRQGADEVMVITVGEFNPYPLVRTSLPSVQR